MSTSLGIQGLDSKIDDFVTEQKFSQRANASHLESIQDGVQAVAALQSTTQEATLDISRSTERIHEILQDIHISQATSQQLHVQQAEKFDKTLAAIQYSLLAISTKEQCGHRTRQKARKTKSRRFVTSGVDLEEERSTSALSSETVRRAVDLSTSSFQINKLVDLAITVRYQCGKAQFKAIAVPDQVFETANGETKLRMVKYLQDLRLLLWLLRRDTYAINGLSAFRNVKRSSYLMSQMDLTSLNHALESLSIFLFPKYLNGHFTKANVENFVTSNVAGWGQISIPIRLSWGYHRLIYVEVVALNLRPNSEMGFHHEAIATDNITTRLVLVRKNSPPLGIDLASIDDMQTEYSGYVQTIVQNDIMGYVPVAYIDQGSELPEKLLGAICSFYNATREEDHNVFSSPILNSGVSILTFTSLTSYAGQLRCT
jgi:hypothetical protein